MQIAGGDGRWVSVRDHPPKCEKTVFYNVFLSTLFEVRKKCKNFFFWAFCGCSKKSARKQCFLKVFRNTLCKVCMNAKKNSAFGAFCATFRKKCEKSVFFTFFETLCTKPVKSAKQQRFLSFLRDVPQKVWDNNVFSCFSRQFVQSSQKMWENSVFLTFFETFCTKFAKKCEKHGFWAFCRMSDKKCDISVFFLVYRDILYKNCKKWEKQRFLSF